MNSLLQIDINKNVKYQGGLRSLDIHPTSKNMIVGTRGSDVMELGPQGQFRQFIVQGHFQGVNDKPEIWGLSTHPTKQMFASSGADKTVRVWENGKQVAVSA